MTETVNDPVIAQGVATGETPFVDPTPKATPDPAPQPSSQEANPAPAADPKGTPPEGSNPEPKTNEDANKPASNSFPQDWREQIAKGDEKVLGVLKRFTSPNALADSYLELRKKISSGELKSPLSKNATPEEAAAYRKDNGIPEKHTDYLNDLPDGLVFGDAEKENLDGFLKDMHEQNAPPSLVKRAFDAYKEGRAREVEATQANDIMVKQETEDALRTEWGADYRENINAALAFVDKFIPADSRAAFENARMGDEKGSPLMHNKHMLETFASLGRLLVSNSKNVGDIGAVNNAESLDEQIKNYEQVKMKEPGWHKDESSQKRYRELLNLRLKMQGK